MRRASLALILSVLVSGCAERWTRPGATEAQTDATNALCRDDAERAVQPLMLWQVVEPGGFVRERRCWREHSGREVCSMTERWRPPRHAWVDANAGAREAWRRDCMRSKGFSFEGYRPLRLFGTGQESPPPVDDPRPEG